MHPILTRALDLMRHRRWKAALGEFQELHAQIHNHAEIPYLMASCYRRLGQYGDAEALVRQALSRRPTWPRALNLLSEILACIGEYAAARQTLNRSLALDARKSDTYRVLAFMRYLQQDYAGALEAIERGLELNANSLACQLRRAQCLRMLKRGPAAFSAVTMVLQREPELPVGHALLAWLQLEAGQFQLALKHFKIALQLDGANRWAQTGLAEARRRQELVLRNQGLLNQKQAQQRRRRRLGLGLVGMFACGGLGLLLALNQARAGANDALLLWFVAFALATWAYQEWSRVAPATSSTTRPSSTSFAAVAKGWLLLVASLLTLLAAQVTGGLAHLLLALAGTCTLGTWSVEQLFQQHRLLPEKRLWRVLHCALAIALLPLLTWIVSTTWLAYDPWISRNAGLPGQPPLWAEFLLLASTIVPVVAVPWLVPRVLRTA